jgi:hypothetical protein
MKKVYICLQKTSVTGSDTTAQSQISGQIQRILEEAIRGDFSGEELEYALQLLNMGQAGSKQAIGGAPGTDDEWKSAAKRLREAVEGLGTDEEAIYAVLLPLNRDPALIKHVKAAYSSAYKEDLRERLIDEMSGTELDHALYLLGEGPKGMDVKYGVEFGEQILTHIKAEAQKRAKTPPTITPASKFYTVLKENYLKDYLAKPSPEEGKKAAEKKIGRQIEGRREGTAVEVKPEGGAWRPAQGRWEAGAVVYWNKEKLPALPAELRDLPIFQNIKTLPTELGAATDVLIEENIAKLPYIDAPFLLGKPNPSRKDLVADVMGGGMNISAHALGYRCQIFQSIPSGVTRAVFGLRNVASGRLGRLRSGCTQ